MGGSAPSSTTSTNTNVSEPWEDIQPSLLGTVDALPGVFGDPTNFQQFTNDALGRITPFADQTQQALDWTQNLATSGNPLVGSSYNALNTALTTGNNALSGALDYNQIAGNYLGGNGTPTAQISPSDLLATGFYGNESGQVSNLMDAVSQDVTNRIDTGAAGFGRLGSGMHQRAMAEGMTEALAPIQYQASEAALNRGSQMYDQSANRATDVMLDMFRNQSGLIDDASNWITSSVGQMSAPYDEEFAAAQALAGVGGVYEGLDNAVRNAGYDQFQEMLNTQSILAGFGGTTTGNGFATSNSGGGFGLSNGLGAALGLATLGSMF